MPVLPAYEPDPHVPLTLGQLAQFMRHPVQVFFRQRLNVVFDAPEAEPEDEPFELTFELGGGAAAVADGDDDYDEDDGDDSASSGSYASLAPADDGLLQEADRLADEDGPVGGGLPGRRRSLISGGGAEGGAPAGAAAAGGSTLFERMANLSRGSRESAEEEDEDDEDGGPSLTIPRFLGRQNNQ